MEPILIDVPEELHTERLHLRLPRVGDGVAVAAAVVASRPELQPFMPWATDTYGDADGEMWCRRVIARYFLREQISYSIYERATGEFIGGLGPHRIDWKVRLCEIGYWIRTDRAGNGFMTEALNAVTAMLGTIGLRRIEVRCDERNLKSAAVARRCGFVHEGTLRANVLDAVGEPRSHMIFSHIVTEPV
jgi:ribosomal-protein-serine acetyltransferase